MTTTPLPFPQAASTPVGPVVPLPVGVRIDRFVVEQALHQGPHGFAYRVREPGHNQPLVLLECFPRALAIRQPDGAVRARQAGDAIALSVVCEAFVQDARALAVQKLFETTRKGDFAQLLATLGLAECFAAQMNRLSISSIAREVPLRQPQLEE